MINPNLSDEDPRGKFFFKIKKEFVVKIEILKWETFNKRSDYKRPHWFALSNRLIEDPDFFDFSGDEFKVWIYILSIASQKSSNVININFLHAERVSNLKKKIFVSTLNKLENLNCIKICTESVRNPNESVQNPYATLHNITEHNITNKHDQNALIERVEEIYKNKYPRKIGKSKGIEKLRNQIKTEEDFVNFENAVLNYEKHCLNQNTEEKFIKHFSTFVNEWRDWIEFKHETKFSKQDAKEKQKQDILNQLLRSSQ